MFYSKWGLRVLGINENNEIIIQGIFTGEPKFSHELFGVKFYEGRFLVNRLSEVKDELIVILSETWLNTVHLHKSDLMQITGQIRSYNEISKRKNKLLLRVFARDIMVAKTISEEPNFVKLKGYLCREPIYRTTPFGREISDLLVAVNRAHQKTDYIPVIAWGSYAKMLRDYKIGSEIEILGRLQSRVYEKVLDSGEIVERVVYEVSSSRIMDVVQIPAIFKEEMAYS